MCVDVGVCVVCEVCEVGSGVTEIYILQLKTQEALYNTVLLPWLQTLVKRDGQCCRLAEAENAERKQLAISEQGRYNVSQSSSGHSLSTVFIV